MKKMDVFGTTKEKKQVKKPTKAREPTKTKKSISAVITTQNLDEYTYEEKSEAEALEAYENLDADQLRIAKRIGLPGTASEVVQKWYNAHITNDYLFSLVMKDIDLCTQLLKVILPEIKGLKVKEVEAQRVLESGLVFRGIRLDIYAIDVKGVAYNIEIQVNDYDDLPKRIRLYQSVMDATALEKGAVFKDLPKSYVIFICMFDFFKAGLAKYTFKTYCTENKEIAFGDELTRVVINANGIAENDKELQDFIDFVAGKTVTGDRFVSEIEQKMELVKEDARARKGFLMHNIQLMSDNRALYLEGIEQGMERGIEQGMEQAFRKSVIKMYSLKYSTEAIAEALDASIEKVETVLADFLDAPSEDITLFK